MLEFACLAGGLVLLPAPLLLLLLFYLDLAEMMIDCCDDFG